MLDMTQADAVPLVCQPGCEVFAPVDEGRIAPEQSGAAIIGDEGDTHLIWHPSNHTLNLESLP